MQRFYLLITSLILLIMLTAMAIEPQFILYVSNLADRLPFLRNQTAVTEQNGLSPGDDRDECGICHYAKSQAFKKRYLHAPFANWHCTDCHVPHNFSSNKSDFVVQVDKLCASCHFDRKGESQMPVQHKPFNKGRCIDCHDPHSSDFPKLLIVDQRRLCQTCH
ncbi:MAG TPA: cytochrome c3 family protein, partial [Bacillota bacterium]|nr:cytochrome c3 family protein [Bacillota bacterium]